jgi:hypothetical protein
MNIVITEKELIAMGVTWIAIMIIAFLRAKKKGTSNVGSREENLKTAFEKLEKTAGDELDGIKVTGKRYKSKVKFDKWSESDVRRLVELGYHWSSDEWGKSYSGELYNEFKRVEGFLGRGIAFCISFKRSNNEIFHASMEVGHYSPGTKLIRFEAKQSGIQFTPR